MSMPSRLDSSCIAFNFRPSRSIRFMLAPSWHDAAPGALPDIFSTSMQLSAALYLPVEP
ncbi:hypothetical protein V2K62_07850 [Pseudomonas alliivorans]|uniref:Uncharacterized protein n=1 Tax=Pseudomonas alliivorans TaxID=2810613 RepID=A0ABS4CAE5_9PSED|nr:hypothetical protein [Pseudomonas alliivorans]MBP0947665.1 hypothetical protein [Pseudomonas alliivorans]MEE4328204.1 hypothetical protein [Pseudomonas alliivorans]MEE4336124.1 hypothetical protein [Pseudomonas alliivorans]MEE4369649.1 hypothetical protein [Pseudomonas alliivorans]MEE4817679.1 hypothetical protein [Pseudomonas alliivorans]